MKLSFKSRLVLITAIMITLWVFRFEMILFMQLQSLKNIGCDSEQRLNSASQEKSPLSICSKVWVHRVNSLTRFQYLMNDFSGFELDAVFVPDSGRFYVRHPPDAVNNLDLESYFQTVASSGKLFWLDIKDLRRDQQLPALQRLLQLKARLLFPGQVIIESSDADFVNLLARNGFKCSFLLLENRLSTSGGQQSRLPVLDSAVNFVSGNVSILQDLKYHFPGKKFLVWSLSAKNFFRTEDLKKLIADPDVEVVLLNIKSRHYR